MVYKGGMEMEIENKVYGIIKDLLGKNDIEVNRDKFLIEDVGFDSVRLMNLIVKLEVEFEIEFYNSNILFESFDHIDDLCNLINDLIKKNEESDNDDK